MKRVTAIAHESLASRVPSGGIAVDATLGNGHDALFLAGLVGPMGEVHGFDVQMAAIEATQRRFAVAGHSMENIFLHHAGHETMQSILPATLHRRIAAVTFNLGYLPGSDKTCTTKPQTTLAAMEQAAELLAIGGILTVVVYPGHPGGAEEAAAVRGFFSALPPAWKITEYASGAAPGSVPFLLAAVRGSD